MAATDTLLSAVEKLQGQVAGRAPTESPIFTGLVKVDNICMASVTTTAAGAFLGSRAVYSVSVGSGPTTFTIGWPPPNNCAYSHTLILTVESTADITWVNALPYPVLWPNGEPPVFDEPGVYVLTFMTPNRNGPTYGFLAGKGFA